MGFCRRCGNIVAGERCKCGGMAVAPVVPWNQSDPKEKTQDRWSKTYVSKDRSPSPTRTANPTGAPTAFAPSSPTKRFPRPLSQSSAPTPLTNRVSAHITSTTSQLSRPPSPLKYSALAAPEAGILPSPSPHDPTLSKVYGSVLQPRESLTIQSCAICETPFVPSDPTIYPDPHGSSTPGPPRFFCRKCFIVNGGSRGPCASCSRPVLILKSEGGFIHAADKYWHKRCFDCVGCHKNIGESPMVDLLGRPSCVDCFDNCLERDATPKKSRSSTNSPRVDKNTNIGGMGGGSKSRSREGSPALEELEQRLGIAKTREASPALEELSHRLSMIGKESPTRSPRVSAYSGSPSMNAVPSRHSISSRESSPLLGRSRGKSDPLADPTTNPPRRYDRFRSPEPEQRSKSPSLRYSSGSPSPVRKGGSPVPTDEAIEEMKRRFMKGSSSSPATSTTSTPPLSRPALRSSRSFSSAPLFSPTIPPTPDLTSDFSDTTSSSGPDSPPRDSGTGYDDVDVFNVSKAFAPGYGSRYTRDLLADDAIAEETSSQMGTPTHTPTSTIKEKKTTPAKSPIPFTNASQSKSPRGLSIVPPELSASTSCTKCRRALFSVEEGGRYVTVPDDVTGKPQTYHTDCFTCISCNKPFKEGAHGQAVFVKGDEGASHVECVPPHRINIKLTPSSTSVTSIFAKADPLPATRPPPSRTTSSATYASSSRYDRPPLTAPPTSTPSSFPRFGTSSSCPGCHKSVSPMERGVVPGPQGSRWHASCLVCGGKKEVAKGWGARVRDERKKGVPGCGKKLDSAAKSDGEGGIWCRECSMLLPVGMRGSPQGSPTRSPLVPSYTGTSGFGKVAPQFTGTTTIARQFTGYGGDPGIFRQLTGGGLSPTRSISPTKGLTNGLRPRPKSVVGIRNTNIVRQMTGSGL